VVLSNGVFGTNEGIIDGVTSNINISLDVVGGNGTISAGSGVGGYCRSGTVSNVVATGNMVVKTTSPYTGSYGVSKWNPLTAGCTESNVLSNYNITEQD
jgi:hypothetical protein